MVPNSITIYQYVAAAKAFCAALGFDAKHIYYPLVLTEDAIYLNTTPVRDGSADQQLSVYGNGLASLQDGDHSAAVLAVPVRIGVVR